MIKKYFIVLVGLFLGCLAVSGQDKIVYIPKELDPSFLYISKYSPEYYYECHEIEGKYRQSRSLLDIEVRTLHNFSDDKTFTYINLTKPATKDTPAESATLYTYEVESLLTYLRRVADIMSVGAKDHKSYCYNSASGLFFKLSPEQSKSAIFLLPTYSLKIFLPKGAHLIIKDKTPVEQFIQMFTETKSYISDDESNFLKREEAEPKDDWEMKEV